MNTSDVKIYKTVDINPAVYNPREISEESFNGLKESIKKFGLVENLIVNTRTGNLCGGHQRLKACKELGITEVPVIEVDLSDTEEKALNIALNSQEISGKYTDDLQDILQEIKVEFEEYDDLKLDMLEIRVENFDSKEDEEVDLKFDFKIEVDCLNEDNQEKLLKELENRGFKVRVLL